MYTHTHKCILNDGESLRDRKYALILPNSFETLKILGIKVFLRTIDAVYQQIC